MKRAVMTGSRTGVPWEIEVSSEFEQWWDSLDEAEREDVRSGVGLLEERGPTLPFPYSSGVVISKHANMRELRVQHQGRPYRILYAFDPRRVALLLIGGDKTGNDRWYEENVPVADSHLRCALGGTRNVTTNTIRILD